MKLRIFKIALLAIVACLAVSTVAFAQKKHKAKSSSTVKIDKEVDEKSFDLNLDDLGKNLEIKLDNVMPDIKLDLQGLHKSINLSLANIAPQVKLSLKKLENLNLELGDISPSVSLNLDNLENNISINYSTDNQEAKIENREVKEKTKTYSKSYPLDAHDRVKVSNEYGKINVITWDKREVKVDVVVRAEANDESDAQKLLDGVEIEDSKSGDQVSFNTNIQRKNGFGGMLNWGNRSKVRKLEISYTVYMPAKTDLEVEQSYGSINLPNLDGRVKISSSYTSVVAQNLSNTGNVIDGSYGNLKMGYLNGGKLDFSYGNVDMAECNNIKADLSYGSFKLGRLKGTADLDLSYVGGFKIGEMAASVKRLNINSSYSGITVGLAGNSSFDFDITVSNSGFNYNDDKVNVTSKTPSDSRHYSSTRNYRGHVGKAGSDARVSVNSSYGGVHFE
jgi:hypothetical protein